MTSKGHDEAAAADVGGSSAKSPKSYGRRASTNLKTARRSLEAVDWQPDERARHLVAEASVLALLDLAEAIRDAKENGAAA